MKHQGKNAPPRKPMSARSRILWTAGVVGFAIVVVTLGLKPRCKEADLLIQRIYRLGFSNLVLRFEKNKGLFELDVIGTNASVRYIDKVEVVEPHWKERNLTPP